MGAGEVVREVVGVLVMEIEGAEGRGEVIVDMVGVEYLVVNGRRALLALLIG